MSRRTAQTRTLLLLLASSSLFGTSYVTLMPVFARDVLHGSSDLLRLSDGGGRRGALIGALSVSRLPHEVLGARSVSGGGVFRGVAGCVFAVEHFVAVVAAAWCRRVSA